MNPNNPNETNDPTLKPLESPEIMPPAPEVITPSTSLSTPLTQPESPQSVTETAGPSPQPETVAMLESKPEAPTPAAASSPASPTPQSQVSSSVMGGGVTQPVVSSASEQSHPYTPPPSGKPKGHKKLLVIVAAALLVLIAAAGYVFAIYLPNRPSAVYATSFRNTADAVDALIEEAQAVYDTDSYAGVAATADFSYAANGSAADGSAAMTLDRTGVFTGTVDLNFMGQKFNAEVRGVDVAQSESPDIYLKLGGLNALESYLGPDMTAKLNGQWIVFDHTLLDGAQSAVTGEEAVETLPSKEAVYEASAAVQQVNRDYLFSDDAEKAVFSYDEYVGKEQLHDRDVYHYKVSVDKAHLKTYIEELSKALDETKLGDWAKEQYADESIETVLGVEVLYERADKLVGDKKFDMYVDLETKLIQSIGYNAEEEDGTRTRILISQLYTGGDSYPFELSIATSKDGKAQGDASVKLTYSRADKSATLGVAYNGAGENRGTKFTLDLSAKPTEDALKVEAPSGARSINDVVAEMFGGYGVLGEQTTVPNISALTQLGIGE